MLIRPLHNTYRKPSIPLHGVNRFESRSSATAVLDKALSGMFDLENFRTPGQPAVIAAISVPRIDWNILRMPIKRPHGEYRIPRALGSMEPLIRLIADEEARTNILHDQTHAHITLERQFVLSGETQRMPSFHVDGFQRKKKGHYTEVEHSYILTDVYPTEFSLAGYDLSWVADWAHMFSVMDRLVSLRDVVTLEANTLYKMSCYQVHRTPFLPRSTWRSFLRVTYAMRELEDPRNTVNPYFDGQVYRGWAGDVRNKLKETQ